jgi:hypothetical protein
VRNYSNNQDSLRENLKRGKSLKIEDSHSKKRKKEEEAGALPRTLYR